MNTQVFYTSRTFWTMVLGLAVFIANKVWQFQIPNELIVGVMAILGIVFRWTAVTPLAIKK